MIRKSELNPNDYRLTKARHWNLLILGMTLNEIRAEWGQSMIVTNSIRTESDHQRIYDVINARRIMQEKPPIPIPWGSAHLQAAAADISDPGHKLWDFIDNNWQLWEELDLDLYIEDKRYTRGHHRSGDYTHIQIIPPASGNRVFVPY